MVRAMITAAGLVAAIAFGLSQLMPFSTPMSAPKAQERATLVSSQLEPTPLRAGPDDLPIPMPYSPHSIRCNRPGEAPVYSREGILTGVIPCTPDQIFATPGRKFAWEEIPRRYQNEIIEGGDLRVRLFR